MPRPRFSPHTKSSHLGMWGKHYGLKYGDSVRSRTTGGAGGGPESDGGGSSLGFARLVAMIPRSLQNLPLFQPLQHWRALRLLLGVQCSPICSCWSRYTHTFHVTATAMSQTGLFDASSDFINLFTINVDSPHSINLEIPPINEPGPRSKKRRQGSTNLQAVGRGGGGTKDAARILACLRCRQQKIKCYRKTSTCDRCERLEIPCIVPDEDERLRPSSKRRTRELERKVESLEKQLRESEERAKRNLYLTPPSSVPSSNSAAPPASCNDSVETTSVIDFNKTHHTLIARLCAEKPHFRADESGLARYYGPTSSLHTSEKMPYNFLKSDDTSTLR